MADKTSVAITLVVAAIVLFVGFQIVVAADFPSQEELEAEREAFAEYCTAEFGEDASVYRANDAMSSEHNGLHCDHDAGTVHKSQIPQEVWDAYVAGEVEADYVTGQLEDPPGILPIPDAGPFTWIGSALFTLVMALVITAYAVYW